MENIYSLEFNMFNNEEKKFSISKKELEKLIYSRDNICVCAVLKSNSNPRKGFIICNTHILFNKNRGDIKLGQITQVLNFINKLNEIYSKKILF